MVAHDVNAAVEPTEDPVLESSYPMVPMPALAIKSAVEFVLKAAAKNVELGRKNWLTNSVTGETLTFADIEPLSRSAASAMHKRGMEKGDVALYLTTDVTRIYTLVLGVWRLGGVMYSSYPEDTEDTLLTRLRESKAKWVFCDAGSLAQVKSATRNLSWSVEILVFGEIPEADKQDIASVDELFEDDGADCPSTVPVELTDPILILCTSGTTGKSKGAVHTSRSVLGFCLGTGGIPRTERSALLLLRCTHVLGMLFPIRNACVGHHGIMMHQVTKTNIFKAVHDYKPVFGFGFPTFFIALAIDPEAQQYDRSSLESVCVGGMMVTTKYIAAIMSLPSMRAVFNGYGMTECAALTTTLDLSGTADFKPLSDVPEGSVGRLYPNTSMKVFDMDTGKPLGVGQRGELAFRSPIMCSAYYNRPEQSAADFKDGWFRSGDLGYYDENGWIYVIDRIKETFKYYNNHISPTEIEEIMIKHPSVMEASVFGVQDPDGGDHIPRAIVVLKPGAPVVTPEDIRAFTDARVAEYKKLRGGVYIVAALPRGKTGKIVRSMVAEMPLPPPAY